MYVLINSNGVNKVKLFSNDELDDLANEEVKRLKARIAELEEKDKQKVQELILSHKEGNQSAWTLYKNILKKAIAGGAAVMTAAAMAAAAIGIPVALLNK